MEKSWTQSFRYMGLLERSDKQRGGENEKGGMGKDSEHGLAGGPFILTRQHAFSMS